MDGRTRRPDRVRRTFVAILLPDVIRRALVDATADDRPDGLRWTQPGQLHLTLTFIGDTELEADDVAAVVQPTTGPIDGTLRGSGRFDDRVLWAGVQDEPPGALHELVMQLRAGFGEAGIPFDPRPFRPHVTIARAGRRQVKARDVRWLDDRVPERPWTISELHVMHSHSGEGPARHESMARVTL